LDVNELSVSRVPVFLDLVVVPLECWDFHVGGAIDGKEEKRLGRRPLCEVWKST
jgi:hypothetical protein